MTPQVNLDGVDRVAQAAPTPTTAPAPVLTPLAGRMETTTPHELTVAERQGLAMSWLAITLGMFLLLSGLALGAALAFKVGFGGWLLGTGLMGLIILAAVVAVNVVVLRPGR